MSDLKTIRKRFIAKVKKTRGCWIWMASKYPNGYGQFRPVIGDTGYAHRWALKLDGHDVAPNAVVCHKCDTPDCVKPAHLYIGTNKSNTYDAIRRGRFMFFIHTPGSTLGERNGASKVDSDQVREIRHLYSQGMLQSELAERFKITKGAISSIVTRKNWKHI